MEEKKLHIVDIDLPPNKTPGLFAKITVKPSYAITSIKQSPVLKGHLFLVLS
jgi:hypothetical protein